jgi:cobalt-zinc-cadmium efflux system membrane fusion protein
VVTSRSINPGEQAAAQALFVISDLTQLWVELAVFPRDASRLRAGQSVRVRALDGENQSVAEIVKVSPTGLSNTQALQAWARLPESLDWTVGQYVKAEVLVGGAEVPLAINRAALQTFRDFTVAFENIADTYEVRMLELGRSDGEYVEVREGLKAGARYVARNSYLIKADIEKSGASHDH